jgi:hypothetical protein
LLRFSVAIPYERLLQKHKDDINHVHVIIIDRKEWRLQRPFLATKQIKQKKKTVLKPEKHNVFYLKLSHIV